MKDRQADRQQADRDEEEIYGFSHTDGEGKTQLGMWAAGPTSTTPVRWSQGAPGEKIPKSLRQNHMTDLQLRGNQERDLFC